MALGSVSLSGRAEAHHDGPLTCPTPSKNYPLGDEIGAGRNHKGLDIMVPYNTPMYATQNGIADGLVQADGGGWGLYIALYSSAHQYRYAHLSRVDREGGVRAGDYFGRSGDSGNAKGTPHLHWETWTPNFQTPGGYNNPGPLVFWGLCKPGAPPAKPPRDLPAVYRGGWFYLRLTQSSGPAHLAFPFGDTGDKGLMCDWDRNGNRSPGVFRDGTFFLRNSNSAGPANQTFPFGNAGDKPLCGDWDNNGFESVGVHRGNMFYLRNNNSAGPAEVPPFPFGNAGDIPLACDWEGNGFSSVGVFRNGWFYLTNNNFASPANYAFQYGNATDTPVCGDWDANGTETIGVYRNGIWYLRNSNSAGPADVVFSFGNAGDKPLAWH